MSNNLKSYWYKWFWAFVSFMFWIIINKRIVNGFSPADVNPPNAQRSYVNGKNVLLLTLANNKPKEYVKRIGIFILCCRASTASWISEDTGSAYSVLQDWELNILFKNELFSHIWKIRAKQLNEKIRGRLIQLSVTDPFGSTLSIRGRVFKENI